MTPLVVDVGAVGSPVDVATFVAVVLLIAYELRPEMETLGAAIVALARREDGVDDEQLQSELEVADRDVAALETTVVRTDGGEEES